MARARTMRFDPTASATGTIAVTWATGIPALSSSTVIAAPLRVLVPQVEVKITEVYARCLEPLGHLPPDAPAIFQWVAVPRCGQELVVQFAHQAALLHLSQHIHRDQAVWVLLDISVVVAAVGH